jgi:8-amino-7-oxononanoate synthase
MTPAAPPADPPPDPKGRLSKQSKAALLATLKDGRQRAARGPSEAERGRDSSAPFPSARQFADLPAYQDLKKQSAAAELLGIENPFFRVHDGRAGANTRIAGRSLVNFGSYDYLGFNQHPAVAAAAQAAIETFGTSVSASRLVAGERALHRQLERKLAALYDAEDALVFVSGHATNVATLGELLGPKDLILADALIHNSVLVGAELSGAARRSFPHNDLAALKDMLAASRAQFDNVLIVVEGLYSMDGDLPDLPALVELKRQFGAWLMVDEAHALGVLGAGGRGTAEHFGLDPRNVDIWMGTLSKTLAACGGFIAGCTALVETLKCRASGFVYSVGMPAAMAAAALAALDLMACEPARVARLRRLSQHFLALAKAAGLDTGLAEGFAIIPVMVGDSLRAAKLANRLFERGFNVMPIVYPAVPMQSARLRFFLAAEHRDSELAAAVAATQEELARLAAQNFGLGGLLGAPLPAELR